MYSQNDNEFLPPKKHAKETLPQKSWRHFKNVASPFFSPLLELLSLSRPSEHNHFPLSERKGKSTKLGSLLAVLDFLTTVVTGLFLVGLIPAVPWASSFSFMWKATLALWGATLFVRVILNKRTSKNGWLASIRQAFVGDWETIDEFKPRSAEYAQQEAKEADIELQGIQDPNAPDDLQEPLLDSVPEPKQTRLGAFWAWLGDMMSDLLKWVRNVGLLFLAPLTQYITFFAELFNPKVKKDWSFFRSRFVPLAINSGIYTALIVAAVNKTGIFETALLGSGGTFAAAIPFPIVIFVAVTITYVAGALIRYLGERYKDGIKTLEEDDYTSNAQNAIFAVPNSLAAQGSSLASDLHTSSARFANTVFSRLVVLSAITALSFAIYSVCSMIETGQALFFAGKLTYVLLGYGVSVPALFWARSIVIKPEETTEVKALKSLATVRRIASKDENLTEADKTAIAECMVDVALLEEGKLRPESKQEGEEYAQYQPPSVPLSPFASGHDSALGPDVEDNSAHASELAGPEDLSAHLSETTEQHQKHIDFLWGITHKQREGYVAPNAPGSYGPNALEGLEAQADEQKSVRGRGDSQASVASYASVESYTSVSGKRYKKARRPKATPGTLAHTLETKGRKAAVEEAKRLLSFLPEDAKAHQDARTKQDRFLNALTIASAYADPYVAYADAANRYLDATGSQAQADLAHEIGQLTQDQIGSFVDRYMGNFSQALETLAVVLLAANAPSPQVLEAKVPEGDVAAAAAAMPAPAFAPSHGAVSELQVVRDAKQASTAYERKVEAFRRKMHAFYKAVGLALQAGDEKAAGDTLREEGKKAIEKYEQEKKDLADTKDILNKEISLFSEKNKKTAALFTKEHAVFAQIAQGEKPLFVAGELGEKSRQIFEALQTQVGACEVLYQKAEEATARVGALSGYESLEYIRQVRDQADNGRDAYTQAVEELQHTFAVKQNVFLAGIEIWEGEERPHYARLFNETNAYNDALQEHEREWVRRIGGNLQKLKKLRQEEVNLRAEAVEINKQIFAANEASKQAKGTVQGGGNAVLNSLMQQCVVQVNVLKDSAHLDAANANKAQLAASAEAAMQRIKIDPDRHATGSLAYAVVQFLFSVLSLSGAVFLLGGFLLGQLGGVLSMPAIATGVFLLTMLSWFSGKKFVTHSDAGPYAESFLLMSTLSVALGSIVAAARYIPKAAIGIDVSLPTIAFVGLYAAAGLAAFFATIFAIRAALYASMPDEDRVGERKKDRYTGAKWFYIVVEGLAVIPAASTLIVASLAVLLDVRTGLGAFNGLKDYVYELVTRSLGGALTGPQATALTIGFALAAVIASVAAIAFILQDIAKRIRAIEKAQDLAGVGQDQKTTTAVLAVVFTVLKFASILSFPLLFAFSSFGYLNAQTAFAGITVSLILVVSIFSGNAMGGSTRVQNGEAPKWADYSGWTSPLQWLNDRFNLVVGVVPLKSRGLLAARELGVLGLMAGFSYIGFLMSGSYTDRLQTIFNITGFEAASIMFGMGMLVVFSLRIAKLALVKKGDQPPVLPVVAIDPPAPINIRTPDVPLVSVKSLKVLPLKFSNEDLARVELQEPKPLNFSPIPYTGKFLPSIPEVKQPEFENVPEDPHLSGIKTAMPKAPEPPKPPAPEKPPTPEFVPVVGNAVLANSAKSVTHTRGLIVEKLKALLLVAETQLCQRQEEGLQGKKIFETVNTIEFLGMIRSQKDKDQNKKDPSKATPQKQKVDKKEERSDDILIILPTLDAGDPHISDMALYAIYALEEGGIAITDMLEHQQQEIIDKLTLKQFFEWIHQSRAAEDAKFQDGRGEGLAKKAFGNFYMSANKERVDGDVQMSLAGSKYDSEGKCFPESKDALDVWSKQTVPMPHVAPSHLRKSAVPKEDNLFTTGVKKDGSSLLTFEEFVSLNGKSPAKQFKQADQLQDLSAANKRLKDISARYKDTHLAAALDAQAAPADQPLQGQDILELGIAVDEHFKIIEVDTRAGRFEEGKGFAEKNKGSTLSKVYAQKADGSREILWSLEEGHDMEKLHSAVKAAKKEKKKLSFDYVLPSLVAAPPVSPATAALVPEVKEEEKKELNLQRLGIQVDESFKIIDVDQRYFEGQEEKPQVGDMLTEVFLSEGAPDAPGGPKGSLWKKSGDKKGLDALINLVKSKEKEALKFSYSKNRYIQALGISVVEERLENGTTQIKVTHAFPHARVCGIRPGDILVSVASAAEGDYEMLFSKNGTLNIKTLPLFLLGKEPDVKVTVRRQGEEGDVFIPAASELKAAGIFFIQELKMYVYETDDKKELVIGALHSDFKQTQENQILRWVRYTPKDGAPTNHQVTSLFDLKAFIAGQKKAHPGGTFSLVGGPTLALLHEEEQARQEQAKAQAQAQPEPTKTLSPLNDEKEEKKDEEAAAHEQAQKDKPVHEGARLAVEKAYADLKGKVEATEFGADNAGNEEKIRSITDAVMQSMKAVVPETPKLRDLIEHAVKAEKSLKFVQKRFEDKSTQLDRELANKETKENADSPSPVEINTANGRVLAAQEELDKTSKAREAQRQKCLDAEAALSNFCLEALTAAHTDQQAHAHADDEKEAQPEVKENVAALLADAVADYHSWFASALGGFQRGEAVSEEGLIARPSVQDLADSFQRGLATASRQRALALVQATFGAHDQIFPLCVELYNERREYLRTTINGIDAQTLLLREGELGTCLSNVFELTDDGRLIQAGNITHEEFLQKVEIALTLPAIAGTDLSRQLFGHKLRFEEFLANKKHYEQLLQQVEEGIQEKPGVDNRLAELEKSQRGFSYLCHSIQGIDSSYPNHMQATLMGMVAAHYGYELCIHYRKGEPYGRAYSDNGKPVLHIGYDKQHFSLLAITDKNGETTKITVETVAGGDCGFQVFALLDLYNALDSSEKKSISKQPESIERGRLAAYIQGYFNERLTRVDKEKELEAQEGEAAAEELGGGKEAQEALWAQFQSQQKKKLSSAAASASAKPSPAAEDQASHVESKKPVVAEEAPKAPVDGALLAAEITRLEQEVAEAADKAKQILSTVSFKFGCNLAAVKEGIFKGGFSIGEQNGVVADNPLESNNYILKIMTRKGVDGADVIYWDCKDRPIQTKGDYQALKLSDLKEGRISFVVCDADGSNERTITPPPRPLFKESEAGQKQNYEAAKEQERKARLDLTALYERVAVDVVKQGKLAEDLQRYLQGVTGKDYPLDLLEQAIGNVWRQVQREGMKDPSSVEELLAAIKATSAKIDAVRKARSSLLELPSYVDYLDDLESSLNKELGVLMGQLPQYENADADAQVKYLEQTQAFIDADKEVEALLAKAKEAAAVAPLPFELGLTLGDKTPFRITQSERAHVKPGYRLVAVLDAKGEKLLWDAENYKGQNYFTDGIEIIKSAIPGIQADGGAFSVVLLDAATGQKIGPIAPGPLYKKEDMDPYWKAVEKRENAFNALVAQITSQIKTLRATKEQASLMGEDTSTFDARIDGLVEDLAGLYVEKEMVQSQGLVNKKAEAEVVARVQNLVAEGSGGVRLEEAFILELFQSRKALILQRRLAAVAQEAEQLLDNATKHSIAVKPDGKLGIIYDNTVLLKEDSRIFKINGWENENAPPAPEKGKDYFLLSVAGKREWQAAESKSLSMKDATAGLVVAIQEGAKSFSVACLDVDTMKRYWKLKDREEVIRAELKKATDPAEKIKSKIGELRTALAEAKDEEAEEELERSIDDLMQELIKPYIERAAKKKEQNDAKPPFTSQERFEIMGEATNKVEKEHPEVGRVSLDVSDSALQALFPLQYESDDEKEEEKVAEQAPKGADQQPPPEQQGVPVVSPAPQDEKEPGATPVTPRGNLTHYEVLGVARDADLAAIKIAYRKFALVMHPDKVPGGRNATPEQIAEQTARFRRLNEAYACLSKEAERQAYDASLGGQADTPVSRIPAEERYKIRQYLKHTFRDELGWAVWNVLSDMHVFYMRHASPGIAERIKARFEEMGFANVDVRETLLEGILTYTIEGVDLETLQRKANEAKEYAPIAQSAEQNFDEAMGWIGDMFAIFDVEGMQADVFHTYMSEALALFHTAGKQGDVRAMYLYASYIRGIYGENFSFEPADIATFLQAAAKAGIVEAKCHLVRYYYSGKPEYLIEKNQEIAKQIAATIDYGAETLPENYRKALLKRFQPNPTHASNTLPEFPPLMSKAAAAEQKGAEAGADVPEVKESPVETVKSARLDVEIGKSEEQGIYFSLSAALPDATMQKLQDAGLKVMVGEGEEKGPRIYVERSHKWVMDVDVESAKILEIDPKKLEPGSSFVGKEGAYYLTKPAAGEPSVLYYCNGPSAFDRLEVPDMKAFRKAVISTISIPFSKKSLMHIADMTPEKIEQHGITIARPITTSDAYMQTYALLRTVLQGGGYKLNTPTTSDEKLTDWVSSLRSMLEKGGMMLEYRTAALQKEGKGKRTAFDSLRGDPVVQEAYKQRIKPKGGMVKGLLGGGGGVHPELEVRGSLVDALSKAVDKDGQALSDNTDIAERIASLGVRVCLHRGEGRLLVEKIKETFGHPDLPLYPVLHIDCTYPDAEPVYTVRGIEKEIGKIENLKDKSVGEIKVKRSAREQQLQWAAKLVSEALLVDCELENAPVQALDSTQKMHQTFGAEGSAASAYESALEGSEDFEPETSPGAQDEKGKAPDASNVPGGSSDSPHPHSPLNPHL